MRILQICQRPQRRGAEVFAFQLSAELEKKGHEVRTAYLYPYDGEGRLPLRSQDRVLGSDDSHPLETMIGFRPSLLAKVRSLVGEYQPDIIQVNGARSVKYGVLASALNAATAGAVVYRNIGSIPDWVRGPRRKTFYRLILRRVDGVAAISEESRAGLSGILSRRTTVAVISNAVDPQSLKPQVGRDALRRLHRTPTAAPVVLFVGSLSGEKRVDRLIDAVSAVRKNGVNLHLWIVGEGPLRSELEQRAHDIGLEGCTRFFGANDDVGSLLAAADMLALVSDTEGIPAVVLEAGYMGLPVIATRVGGVPECVVDGTTGILVDPGDRPSLVAALQRMSEEPETRSRMGAAAQERVRERHLIDGVAKQFVDFYSAVLEERSGAGGMSEAVGVSRDLRTFPSSSETRLIVSLSRPVLELEEEERARRLIRNGIDWADFVRLARRHRVTPLVTTHLRRLRELVPNDVQAALARAEFDNAIRILERTRQLFQVLDALEREGVRAVPYKGPALGAQLYGAGSLRVAGDLDLVVRTPDVFEARRVLETLGYRSRVPLDEAAVSFMIRNRYHEEFVREDGGHVELHWRFTNREIAFDLDLDRAWTRLQTVNLNGREVSTFHPEDLLLILSVHGSKHRWDHLEWLAGLAELVRRSDDLDWSRLIDRASSVGVRRTLFLGVSLAADLFQAPVPPTVLRTATSELRVSGLNGYIKHLLATAPAGWELSDRIERDRFRILLQERFRDRIRFVWNRAATPSDPKLWKVARIGTWSVPLHGLFRPLQAVALLWRPSTRIK